jgi:hypothetical protein
VAFSPSFRGLVVNHKPQLICLLMKVGGGGATTCWGHIGFKGSAKKFSNKYTCRTKTTNWMMERFVIMQLICVILVCNVAHKTCSLMNVYRTIHLIPGYCRLQCVYARASISHVVMFYNKFQISWKSIQWEPSFSMRPHTWTDGRTDTHIWLC